MQFVNISDLPDPDNEGKTYRESNLERTHKIPLNTLVENSGGLRMWVAEHTRDCDGTPLYSLSFKMNWKEMTPSKMWPTAKLASRMQLDIGYTEESLKIVDQNFDQEPCVYILSCESDQSICIGSSNEDDVKRGLSMICNYSSENSRDFEYSFECGSFFDQVSWETITFEVEKIPVLKS